MKNLFIASVLAFGFSQAAFAQVQTFKLDPAHSAVIFKVNHLGFSNTFGRFNKISGEVKLDDKNASASSVTVEIDTASVDTNEPKRDAHLKNADFFNAKANPKITFKSTKISSSDNKTYKVNGTITMSGKSKDVSFDFKRGTTGKDPWGGTRTGGDFELKLKRSEFGMNFMQGGIGDEVHLMVSVEGILQ